MTLCKDCRRYIPDILPFGETHTCRITPVDYTYIPYPPSPPITFPITRVKCDMCGSTAIDHTEAQCQINRVIKRATKPEAEAA